MNKLANQACLSDPDCSLNIGCNYWASHAGTRMWQDWKEEQIRSDFTLLRKAGCRWLRVFPLWSDFQPLILLHEYANQPFEYMFEDGPLPDDGPGYDGVSTLMLERFKTLCDIAEEYRIRLSVALITGWMSGRVFAPPAFAGRNLLCDSEVIKWQVRFVQCFVSYFKDHPAIAMWGAGNECNCLDQADPGQFLLWNQIICGAIRSLDPVHPIAAGMHGGIPSGAHRPGGEYLTAGKFSLQDMGRIYDCLTIHPYPAFTAYMGQDILGSYRSVFHIAAEYSYYLGMGKRPVICEEFGTLSEQWGGETEKYYYTRNALLNSYVNGCRTFLWWCGFDHELSHPPYAWSPLERRLGLIDSRGHLKDSGRILSDFSRWVEKEGITDLASPQIDATVLLSYGQNHWANACGAFLLAGQARMQVDFAYFGDGKLPDRSCYLLCGVNHHLAIDIRHWEELLEKVRSGAILYLSLDKGGIIPDFNAVFGVISQGREEMEGTEEVKLGNAVVPVKFSHRHCLAADTAAVLAETRSGRGIFFRHPYGKGAVYLLDAPLEKNFSCSSGVISDHAKRPYYRFYRMLREGISLRKTFDFTEELPQLSVTEHIQTPEQRIVVAVNNSNVCCKAEFRLDPAWQVRASDSNLLEVGRNNAAVIFLEKKCS